MIKLLSLRCYPLLGNDHIYVCNDTHSAMHQWCFISKVFPRLPNCHHKIPPLWRQKLDFLVRAGGNLELFQRLQMESQKVVKNAAWTLDLAHDSMVFHRKLIWKPQPDWSCKSNLFMRTRWMCFKPWRGWVHGEPKPVSIQDSPFHYKPSSQADWK